MNEPRIDPDYAPSEEVLRAAAFLLAKASGQMLVGNYQEEKNGANTLLNLLLLVIAGLLVAGIGGEILVYGKVQALEATQTAEANELAEINKRLDFNFRNGLAPGPGKDGG